MTFRSAFVAMWSMCVCVSLSPPHATAATNGAPFGGTAAALPGTIEAENFDEGGASVAYFDTTPGNRGGAYRQTDVDIEACTDAGGGFDVGWVRSGEWLQYTTNVTASGPYAFELRVASLSTGGTLRIDVDGADVTGELTVPNTGGWQTWTTIRKDGIALQAGLHHVRLVFVKAGTKGIGNVNFINVVWSSTVTPPPPTGLALVAPANGAVGTALTTVLSWTASGATSYDVMFGTSNPPPAAATALTAASYTTPSLSKGTTYYWQVIARNAGGTAAGPAWSFTTAGLPSSWTADDVGAVVLTGSASYANGAFNVAGAGADVWGTADAFQFVSQTVSGDTQIVARVVSLMNTQAKAKAGVMLRESNATDAAHVLLDVKPAGGGVEFLTRQTAGGLTTKQRNTPLAAPVYVRLTRSGTNVTGAVSSDGVTWTTVGSTTTSAALPLAGLIVNSHDTPRLNTAIFDNATISPPAPPPPPPPPGVSPTAYNAVTDRTPYAKPPLPPLGPAGFTFTDPTFGSKILRVTDALTRPGLPGASFRVPSNLQVAAWNATSTAFYVISNDGTAIPFLFDSQTMSAVRVQPTWTDDSSATLSFYGEPHFSLVTPNVIYGAVSGANNRTVGQYDFQSGLYTPILDLDTIVSGLTGFLGVVETGGVAPEKLLTMFGGGEQDQHY